MQVQSSSDVTKPSQSISQKVKTLPRSTLVSRNVTISGHRTSVRLEPEMWSGLTEICRREGASLHELGTAVAVRKADNTSLTAAIRVFVMVYYRTAATEDGHVKVNHGRGLARNAFDAAAAQQTPAVATVSKLVMASQQQQAVKQTSLSPAPFMIGASYRMNGNGAR